MNKPVYLNYAATSIKKPKSMVEAVSKFIFENNEAGYNQGLSLTDGLNIPFIGRETVADFFNVKDSSHVIFTQNITTSLNMIINGLLEAGDHVVTTSIEHNAVMRPLGLIGERQWIEVTTIPCNHDGAIDLNDLEDAICSNTKVLIVNHASNVLGNILPIREMFEIAKRHNIITVLDSAQTAGFIPIDMVKDSIDILAFTGHKSLQAFPGIGGFAVTNEVAKVMKPWMVGGTGSLSHSFNQPDTMPEKFESGTKNSIGILSLTESIKWLTKTGLNNIAKRELEHVEVFLKGLEDLSVRVLGTKDASNRVPVVTIVADDISPDELSFKLYEDYQIITRSGLHCAPSAHMVAGTFETGAIRFSFGYETTKEEVEYALESLKHCLGSIKI